MPRNINTLLTALSSFDGNSKQASSPENLKDPNEHGVISATPGGTDISTALTGAGESGDGTATPTPGPAGSPKTTDATPIPGPNTARTEEGTGPSAPATAPQVEYPSGAPSADIAKSAFDNGLAGLKSKLAGFGAPAPAPAAPAAQAPAAAPAEQPKAAAAAPAAPVAQSAPIGAYHVKAAQHLMSTPRGRQLMSEALDEVLGLEGARGLMKSAAAEQDQFETEFLQRKFAAAEQAQIKQAHADLSNHLGELHRELTKSASAEEKDKVAATAELLSRAELPFKENLQAHSAFVVGVKSAAAVMDAQAQGAPDPMAAAAPPAGPPQGGEIEAALAQLVSEGALNEQQAIAILEALAGGAGGGAPAGAPPADPMAAAGGAPPVDPMAAAGGAPPAAPAEAAPAGPPAGGGGEGGGEKKEGGEGGEKKEEKSEKEAAADKRLGAILNLVNELPA